MGTGLSRTKLLRAAVTFTLLLLAFPTRARAGMPTLDLTDIARLRLQTMSFFLLLLLGSAGAVMLIWNLLRRDFTRLPRMTYLKSLGVVGLWGMLFLLVLTMISGARELMTPGAWERDGALYRLAPVKDRDVVKDLDSQRRPRLEALKAALWMYAAEHEQALPDNEQLASQVPSSLLETSDPSRARFVYVGAGRRAGTGNAIIAFEPPIFVSDPLVLRSDGWIGPMHRSDLDAALGNPNGERQ